MLKPRLRLSSLRRFIRVFKINSKHTDRGWETLLSFNLHTIDLHVILGAVFNAMTYFQDAFLNLPLTTQKSYHPSWLFINDVFNIAPGKIFENLDSFMYGI